MSNYDRFLEPRRRGMILALLRQAGESGISLPALASMVQSGGYRAAREQIETDCAMLAHQLLVLQRAVGGVTFVSITSRGVDVASGNLRLPGVERVDDAEV